MDGQKKAALQVALRKALFASLNGRVEGWMPDYQNESDDRFVIDGTFDLDTVSLDLANAVERFLEC